MNNRYIDFVPLKHQKTPHGEFDVVEEPKTTVIYHESMTISTAIPEEVTAAFLEQPTPAEEDVFCPQIKIIKKPAPAPAPTPSREEAPIRIDAIQIHEQKPAEPRRATYGEVENYTPANLRQPVFTNTHVEKRPLYNPSMARPAQSISEIKSKKLVKKSLNIEKSQPTPKANASEFSKFDMPKNPFINTSVEKRPLSKNIYHREPLLKKPEPKEEEQTIEIVENTKKSSALKTFFTILITIILGIAVGTLAFFLLPQ